MMFDEVFGDVVGISGEDVDHASRNVGSLKYLVQIQSRKWETLAEETRRKVSK